MTDIKVVLTGSVAARVCEAADNRDMSVEQLVARLVEKGLKDAEYRAERQRRINMTNKELKAREEELLRRAREAGLDVSDLVGARD